MDDFVECEGMDFVDFLWKVKEKGLIFKYFIFYCGGFKDRGGGVKGLGVWLKFLYKKIDIIICWCVLECWKLKL